MPLGDLVHWGSDFLGGQGTAAAIDAAGIQCFGVGTETYGSTVDESGGISANAPGANDDDIFVDHLRR